MKKFLFIFLFFLIFFGRSQAAIEYDLWAVSGSSTVYIAYNNWTEPEVIFYTSGNIPECGTSSNHAVILNRVNMKTKAIIEQYKHCIWYVAWTIARGSRSNTTYDIFYNWHRLISRVLSISGTFCLWCASNTRYIQWFYYNGKSQIFSLSAGIPGNNAYTIIWDRIYVSNTQYININTMEYHTHSDSITRNINPQVSRIIYINSVWDVTQWIYYNSANNNEYKKYDAQLITTGVYEVLEQTIFNNNIFGGELQRLSIPSWYDPWGSNRIQFTSWFIWSDRYYYLSICRSNATFPSGGNNVVLWWNRIDNIGSPWWLYDNLPYNPIYYYAIYQWRWLGIPDNNSLWINLWGDCLHSSAFADFVGGIPTRLYVYRSGNIYMYTLSEEDISTLFPGTWWFTSTPGWTWWWIWTPDDTNIWEWCNIEWFLDIFTCIRDFFAFLWQKLIQFFTAIPEFIDKILDIVTTESRTVFIPTSYANITSSLLPEKGAWYSDTSIGRIDGMMIWWLYAFLIIVTLITILILIKK
jgi:hypothetical protein